MKHLVNRRALLATGAMAGVGAMWTSLSSSWTARFLRDRLTEVGKDVPRAPQTPAPDTWDDRAITIAWLGHATVLVNFYGLWIVTDPVLFNRIGVDLGVVKTLVHLHGGTLAVDPGLKRGWTVRVRLPA